MRTRPAQVADRPALVALWRRSVEATHHFLTPADVAEIEGQVHHRVLPALTVTVAVDGGGDVLGWIGVDGGRVEGLFVDPAAHRRGVGRALLAAGVGDLPVVDLDVNEQNVAAVAFYEAQGFVRTGRSELDDDGRPCPLLRLRRG